MTVTRNGALKVLSLALLMVGAGYLWDRRADLLAEPSPKETLDFTAEWVDRLQPSARKCDGALPNGPHGLVYVRVTNRTRKTLKSAVFRLHVYERGFSDDLVDYPTGVWDLILAPGERGELCFGPPLKRFPADGVASAELYGAEYYRTGEVIPR